MTSTEIKVRGAVVERDVLSAHLCQQIAGELLNSPRYWTKFREFAQYHAAYFGPIYGKNIPEGGRNHIDFGSDYIMSWPEFLEPLRNVAMQLMEKDHAGIQETGKELLQCNINAYLVNTKARSGGCVGWHTDEPSNYFEPTFFGKKTITICIVGGGTFVLRKIVNKDLPEAYNTSAKVYEGSVPVGSSPEVSNKLMQGDAIVLTGAALHGCQHAAIMDGDLRITANFRIVSPTQFDLATAVRINEQPMERRFPIDRVLETNSARMLLPLLAPKATADV